MLRAVLIVAVCAMSTSCQTMADLGATVFSEPAPISETIVEPVQVTPQPAPPSQEPKVICKLMFKAVFTAAELLADSLGCIDVQAIAADLGEPITKLGLCESRQGRFVIGPLVCPVISSMASEYAIRKLPLDWQCSGGFATVYARKQIAEACLVAFPF